MFGSTIINVAIGLVFIYCLYSLLATTIKEIIASLFSLRANMLEAAVKRMLTDSRPSGASDPPAPNYIFDKFFAHPLIKYMAKDDKSRPSYIHPRNFSKTIVDIITDAGKEVEKTAQGNDLQEGLNYLESQIGKPVQASGPQQGGGARQFESDTIAILRSFLTDANDDVLKFRAMLETWFNDTMDRASGWYKRRTQWILLLIGLVLAVSLNVNTFGIVKRLSADNTTLGQVVQLAANFSKSHPNGTANSSKAFVVDSVVSMRIDSLALFADNISRTRIKQANQLLGLGWESGYNGWQILIAFAGWLVTALAISLGAPFWFDLLSKLVQLRGTGPRPEKEARTVREVD